MNLKRVKETENIRDHMKDKGIARHVSYNMNTDISVLRKRRATIWPNKERKKEALARSYSNETLLSS